MNIFRRLPLYRLLLLCGVAVAVGISATALALALGTGPVPQPKPLAQAVHDALAGGEGAVQGVSANVTLTDHLLEGANLASGGEGGELTSSPLLTGASGRLWIARDGRMRLELQSEKGDTQVLYDGTTLTVYDAATNTVYRYTPPRSEGQAPQGTAGHEVPSTAKIEEAIARLERHVTISDTPSDVAGRAAYTVRVSPREGGSLLGGAELSFDAANGVPLRAAVYSSESSSPVVELAATEVSYGPVAESVFAFSVPPGAKVQELKAPSGTAAGHKGAHGGGKLTTYGHGVSTVAVLEAASKEGAKTGGSLEDLPKVEIDGAQASELRTALGTILTFERAGTRYVLAGAVAPAAIEAIARGL